MGDVIFHFMPNYYFGVPHMNARFYWFTFAIGFGLFVMGMH